MNRFEEMSRGALIREVEAMAGKIERLASALIPFVAKMQKVEDQYRKRGGNPDSFPDTHPSFDIIADKLELPLGVWRRARSAYEETK